MAKTEKYTNVGLFFREGSIPVIRTGPFTFDVKKDVVLADASITYNDDNTIDVTGYTCEWDYHEDYPGGEDLSDKVAEYHIGTSDWYEPKIGRFAKFFGCTPPKPRLSSGWYMKRRKSEQCTYSFIGAVVRHNAVPIEETPSENG